MNCHRCLRTITEGGKFFDLLISENDPNAKKQPVYRLGYLCAHCVASGSAMVIRLSRLEEPLRVMTKTAPKPKRTKRTKRKTAK